MTPRSGYLLTNDDSIGLGRVHYTGVPDHFSTQVICLPVVNFNFDSEDALYNAMDWLLGRHRDIETRLARRLGQMPSTLVGAGLLLLASDPGICGGAFTGTRRARPRRDSSRKASMSKHEDLAGASPDADDLSMIRIGRYPRRTGSGRRFVFRHGAWTD